MKQPRPDPSFQFLNRGRDGGTWHTERVGRAGEARTLNDTGENTEQINSVQGTQYSLLCVFSDK
jgi:hypothetical protein